MASNAAVAAGKLAKSKNLFDLLRVLPNSGVGARVAKASWGDNSYWEITRIKIDPDGSHGKVWGSKRWNGELETTHAADTRIGSPLKTYWEVRQSSLAAAAAAWKSEDWSAIREKLQPEEAGASSEEDTPPAEGA